MSKKVILVIVEGHTEEVILYDYLAERFDLKEVFFDVRYGDMLSDLKNKKENIKNTLGETIKDYLVKRKFLAQDLLAIFHITDTDGCFIPDEHIVIDTSRAEGIFYDNEAIIVNNENKKKAIEERNKYKSTNMKTLATIDLFTIKSRKVPYRLLYFSTNLEHVLWNERNESKDDKVDKAEHFIEELDVTIEQFLQNFLKVESAPSYEEKMKMSWDYVMQQLNSLERSANVSLMFEMVDEMNYTD